jgi:hypothetical protein
MTHNAEAGGSGGRGRLRSLQLSYDEADVLSWQHIPVPLQFKLPHGWHLSNAGYAAATAWTGDAHPHRREAVAHDADRAKPA